VKLSWWGGPVSGNHLMRIVGTGAVILPRWESPGNQGGSLEPRPLPRNVALRIHVLLAARVSGLRRRGAGWRCPRAGGNPWFPDRRFGWWRWGWPP